MIELDCIDSQSLSGGISVETLFQLVDTAQEDEVLELAINNYLAHPDISLFLLEKLFDQKADSFDAHYIRWMIDQRSKAPCDQNRPIIVYYSVFQLILDEYKGYFFGLQQIAESMGMRFEGHEVCPQGILEQCLLKYKQMNLFSLAQTCQDVIEIGCHDGVSTLVMLLANKTSKIALFDQETTPFTQAWVAYLQQCFPNRLFYMQGGFDWLLSGFHRVNPLVQFDLIHIHASCSPEELVANFADISGMVRNHGYFVLDGIHKPERWSLFTDLIAKKRVEWIYAVYPTVFYPHGMARWIQPSNQHEVLPIPKADDWTEENQEATLLERIGKETCLVKRCRKIAILMLCVGEAYTRSVEDGTKTKLRYCATHHYDLICVSDIFVDQDHPVAWAKIQAIQNYLKDYDFLFMLDADTLIMNPSIRLESILEDYMGGHAMMATYDAYHNLNTGALWIRNHYRSFAMLDQMAELSHMASHRWAENFVFIYLYHRDAAFRKSVKILKNPRVFNSYPYGDKHHLYTSGDFILHLPSLRGERLQTSMAQYFSQL